VNAVTVQKDLGELSDAFRADFVTWSAAYITEARKLHASTRGANLQVSRSEAPSLKALTSKDNVYPLSSTPLFPEDNAGEVNLTLMQFLTTKGRRMYPHIFCDGALLEPVSENSDGQQHCQMQYVNSFYPRSEDVACRTEYVMRRDFRDGAMRLLPVQRSVEYEPQVRSAVVRDDEPQAVFRKTTFVTEWTDANENTAPTPAMTPDQVLCGEGAVDGSEGRALFDDGQVTSDNAASKKKRQRDASEV
jgi:hypothetical protein